MKNLCALSLAISASILPSQALAGAWLQKEGEGQVITTLRYYASNWAFDDDGDLKSSDPFAKIDMAAYFEYGTREFLTLGGEISTSAISNQDPGVEDIKGLRFSYGTVFARAYLYNGDKSVISLEPGITFPERLENDLTTDGDGPIPEIKISHGYSFEFNDYYHFIDNSIKYRFRSDDDLKDMIKIESTLGTHLTRDYTLLTQLTYEKVLGNPNSVVGNYELLKPQLSVLHDRGYGMYDQIGIFANVYGENTGAGVGALYSYWIKF